MRSRRVKSTRNKNKNKINKKRKKRIARGREKGEEGKRRINHAQSRNRGSGEFGFGEVLFAMADQFSFTDGGGNVIIEEGKKGLNPGLIVLLVVGGLVLLFLVGNYALYAYAQKTLPPRKKKPVSKKKMKRERLKQGVSAPGE
ncbi:DNA-binding protein S1FA2 [Ananas comosus]|uniref:DNA-binding protein S1FA2 n=2 Tax=Ananas comosus TaxID=4615 RepID=A0A199UT37_ANACO|nr:DNA-binding protein S1FA2 [Ananas comosus]